MPRRIEWSVDIQPRAAGLLGRTKRRISWKRIPATRRSGDVTEMWEDLTGVWTQSQPEIYWKSWASSSLDHFDVLGWSDSDFRLFVWSFPTPCTTGGSHFDCEAGAHQEDCLHWFEGVGCRGHQTLPWQHGTPRPLSAGFGAHQSWNSFASAGWFVGKSRELVLHLGMDFCEPMGGTFQKLKPKKPHGIPIANLTYQFLTTSWVFFCPATLNLDYLDLLWPVLAARPKMVPFVWNVWRCPACSWPGMCERDPRANNAYTPWITLSSATALVIGDDWGFSRWEYSLLQFPWNSQHKKSEHLYDIIKA